MPLNKIHLKVTDRILERSKDSRKKMLAKLQKVQIQFCKKNGPLSS